MWFIVFELAEVFFSLSLVNNTDQRLEQYIHTYTLHVWCTLVGFKTRFDRMTGNNAHMKLKPV